MCPKIADLGPITVHTYGLFLAAAFIAAIYVASRNAKKVGMDSDSIWSMRLVVIFTALIGSKILLLFSDFPRYTENPRELFSLASLRAPAVHYGSLFLALTVSLWFALGKKLPLRPLADIASPGIALGQTIGKIGCLSAGCCYGKPTHVPWAISFTNPYANESLGVPLNIPLHPTQIYEALGAFFIFVFLTRRLSRRHRPGQIIMIYLILSSLLRFAADYFRDDDRGFVLHGLLSTSQSIAILVILGSITAYFILGRGPAGMSQN